MTHPQRCKNGCALYEQEPVSHWNDHIGFCKFAHGKTAIDNRVYIFIQVRGCCAYSQGCL